MKGKQEVGKQQVAFLAMIAIVVITLGFVYSSYTTLQTTLSQLEQTVANTNVESQSADDQNTNNIASVDDLNDPHNNGDYVGTDALLGEFRPITLAEWQLRSYPFTAEEIVADLMKRTDLIPYQATLGGSMFFVPEKIVLLTHNWAVAYFEDGHIHGFLLVEYGVSQQNQLTWKVLDSWIPRGLDYESKVPNDSQVVQLLVKAFNRHWDTRFDYNEADDAVFTVGGTEYMYLSQKYDTEEKMLAYLQEVYTAEISRQLFASYGFETHAGRLYHQYGELGTLYTWKDADLTMLHQKQDKVLYSARVPVGDEYEDKQVELVYLLDRGWRVNTVIDY